MSGALREMAIRRDSPQECLHVAFPMMVTGGQVGFPQSKYLTEPRKAPSVTPTIFYWLQASHKGSPDLKGEKWNSASS